MDYSLLMVEVYILVVKLIIEWIKLLVILFGKEEKFYVEWERLLFWVLDWGIVFFVVLLGLVNKYFDFFDVGGKLVC